MHYVHGLKCHICVCWVSYQRFTPLNKCVLVDILHAATDGTCCVTVTTLLWYVIVTYPENILFFSWLNGDFMGSGWHCIHTVSLYLHICSKAIWSYTCI